MPSGWLQLRIPSQFLQQRTPYRQASPQLDVNRQIRQSPSAENFCLRLGRRQSGVVIFGAIFKLLLLLALRFLVFLLFQACMISAMGCCFIR